MTYDKDTIRQIADRQRTFFRTGVTLDVKWRKSRLREMRDAVRAYEEEFERALAEDLGRSRTEAYLCDIGPVVLEINEIIRGLRRWARPETHFSGLLCFPSLITKVYKMPYGVTLIISPFNFPILLTLGVVAASIAGGNTVVIKASSKSASSTAVLKKFIGEVFSPEHVTLVDGGHDVADFYLEQRWDKIFYTGSPKVGRHVLSAAAGNLTPVALELGGETGNWCVVRKDADIDSVMDMIEGREHPLALYLFTKNIRWADRVMRSHQYGGGCINEVCIHLMVRGVPFGGTGHSGMGAYHGVGGFREFTHPSTVLKGCTRFNLPLREHPYGKEWKLRLLRLFEK